MSNYFSNILEDKIRNSVKADYIPKNLALPKNPYQKVFSGLIAKKASLRDSVSNMKELSSLFSMDIDMFNEDVVYDETDYPGFYVIPTEIGQLLYNTLKGITLTDDRGYCYEFHDGAGDYVGLKLKSGISTLNDVFLINVEDDVWIINQNLESFDYYRRPDIPYDPATDFIGILEQCAYFKNISISHTSIQDIIAFDFLDKAEVTSDDTIYALLYELVNGVSPESPTPPEGVELMDAFLSYYHTCYYEWIESNPDAGDIIKFIDLARQVLCSADLNECIADTVDDLTIGKFNIASFSAKWADSQLHGIQTFYQGVCQAYSKGGILAVGSYILSYFGCFDAIKSDENGYISLTDNSAQIPNEYIVGKIPEILGSIGSIASSIISIVSVPLGMAVNAVSTLLTTIPKYINYSYENETRASLLDRDDIMCLPYSPVAMWQKEYNVEDLNTLLENGDIYDAISNIGKQSPALIFNVPGGALFITRTGDTTYGVEFHPGFVDANVNQELITKNVKVYHPLYDATSHPYAYDLVTKTANGMLLSPLILYLNYANGDVIDIANTDLSNSTNNAAEDDVNCPVLSEAEDTYLRALLLKNCYYFKTWLGLLSQQQAGYSGQIDIGDLYIPTGSTLHSKGNDPDYTISPWVEYGVDSDHNGLAIMTLLCSFQELRLAPTWAKLITLMSDDTVGNPFQDIIGEYGTNKCLRPGVVTFDTDKVAWDFDNDDNTLRNFTIFNIGGVSSNIATLSYLLLGGHYLGDVTIIDFDFLWGFNCPKYNKSTFIKWTILTVAAVAVTTVAAAIITVKVKKWRKAKRMSNELMVENAWEDAKKNPTKENILAYDKARKKNNRWAALTGGTKYSASGFWSQGGSGEDSATSRENLSTTLISNGDLYSDKLAILISGSSIIN